ncbi:MAG: hypothetical protein AABY05_01330 [Nanoarchaeota archaeon]
MASKRKIEKSIESFEKRTAEHKEKIKEYEGPKDYLIDYWEKEIREFERKKTEKERKISK